MDTRDLIIAKQKELIEHFDHQPEMYDDEYMKNHWDYIFKELCDQLTDLEKQMEEENIEQTEPALVSAEEILKIIDSHSKWSEEHEHHIILDIQFTRIARLIASQFQSKPTDELTHDDFHNAIRTINSYYRKVSGRKECIAFHIKYIHPIEEFINQHKTTV